MEKLVLLAIAICFFGFVSDVLPSVSAAHLACRTCGTNLLQTPQQCAESNEQRNCSNATACFAATAELANGTHIGIKDCYEWQGNCSQNTACIQGSNQTGVVFHRCYATCCTDVHCNTMLPSIANFTSSTTQGTTSTGTTGTSEPATTSGALSKDIFNHFFLFLASVHLICFAH